LLTDIDTKPSSVDIETKQSSLSAASYKSAREPASSVWPTKKSIAEWNLTFIVTHAWNIVTSLLTHCLNESKLQVGLRVRVLKLSIQKVEFESKDQNTDLKKRMSIRSQRKRITSFKILSRRIAWRS